MVQYSSLDDTFSALSDPTRRAILEQLGRGTASITELAESAGMSLTGMKKHVGILEEAELVITEKVGRTRHCRLGPGQLDDATRWMEAYRRSAAERYERLDELIEKHKGGGTK